MKQTDLQSFETAVDAKAFQVEQASLTENWSFVGFASDIPNDLDWMTARLGNRSIFIQRFKSELRAFENVCPHRFHPIRNAEKGNGHVVCDFHHWRYDSAGHVVAIPQCKQLYQCKPKEMDAQLNAVEIATYGGLIFARMGEGESLESWLGYGANILNLLDKNINKCGSFCVEVNANWRYLMHISLDDYHVVAVHPTTFGKLGYLKDQHVHYHQFGDHSALIMGVPPKSLDELKLECNKKTASLSDEDYMIFQLFPNLVIASVHAARWLGDDYRYMLVEHFSPKAHNRTHFQARFYLMPFVRQAGLIRRIVRNFAIPLINFIFKHYMMRVTKEDNAICEQQQRVVQQATTKVRLSKHEKRIAWFEAIYAEYMAKRNRREKSAP